MKRTQLYILFFIALIARIAWCVTGWHSDLIGSYENNISIVYQRSAYLHAFGYGYHQTAPGSPAYDDLMIQMDNILHDEPYSTQIKTEGIRIFAQYPPGWPILASLVFTITKIPVPYAMQFLAILVDVIALLLLIKVFLIIFSPKTVFISGLIYSVYPPVLAITSFMTPDSWMIFFIAVLLYIFFFQFNKYPVLSLILTGITTGIAILFRPDFTFIPAFILLSECLSKKNYKIFIRNNLVVYSIAFFILLPWGLYNARENNKFTIFSTALGGTLVTGFAAYDDPLNLGPSDYDRVREANAAGIDAPFEHEGDVFFRKKFGEYVAAYPGYYIKTIFLRTIGFFLPAYSWGLNRDIDVSYSEIRNDGNFINHIVPIFRSYSLNLFSALFAFAGMISLIILAIKARSNSLLITMNLISLCICLSHIFIHMTPAYVIPLVLFQIVSVVEMTQKIFQKRRAS